ncbi:hypothetical protein BH09PLA1_BH09PLA1_34290 [soil metagenome]
MKTVYRSVSGVRRTPRINASRLSQSSNSSFANLLTKLGLASQRLNRQRVRSR